MHGQPWVQNSTKSRGTTNIHSNVGVYKWKAISSATLWREKSDITIPGSSLLCGSVHKSGRGWELWLCAVRCTVCYSHQKPLHVLYISSHRYSCALKNCNVLPSNQDQHTVSEVSSGAIIILSLSLLQLQNGEKKERKQVHFQIMIISGRSIHCVQAPSVVMGPC